MKSILAHLAAAIVGVTLGTSGLAQDIFTNSLIAHYPFVANAKDVSGNGNDGTVHCATLTTDRFGNINSAYAFSGCYISIPFSAGFDIPPNGQFTISVWAKPAVDTVSDSLALFVKGNWDYGLYYGGGNHFYVGDGAAAACISPLVATLGTWYHVVGTYSNGNWAIYINGNLSSTVYDGVRLITQSTGYEAIGRKGTSGMDYFPGDIDDVRFYNRALSSAEVEQLYAYESQQDPLVSGLVAYFPFTATVNDVSGNNNDGTNHGATLTTDRFGNVNSGYSFSGAYVSVPFTSGFDIPPTGQFTISVWAKPANTSHGSVGLFVKGDWDYGLYLNSGNLFFVGNGAGATCWSPIVAAPNTWYHVVGTYANGNWALYINGSLSVAISDTNLISQSTGYEAIGRKGTSGMDYFPGDIDDVRFYNRALSGTDVQRLYAYDSHHVYTTVARAVRLDHQYLLVGTNYQLQVSSDLNSWANFGLPFTATSTTGSQYVDVQNWNTYFRLVAP